MSKDDKITEMPTVKPPKPKQQGFPMTQVAAPMTDLALLIGLEQLIEQFKKAQIQQDKPEHSAMYAVENNIKWLASKYGSDEAW
jgi:hypothetical protein